MRLIERKISIYLITGEADAETIFIADIIKDIYDNARYNINKVLNTIEIEEDSLFKLNQYLNQIETLCVIMKYFTFQDINFMYFRYTNEETSVEVFNEKNILK